MPHENYQACIDACNACAVACNHCAASCLREQNVDEMRKCIALDMDCAQICAFAAAAMSRDSPYAKEICQLCSRVCDDCGTECAGHETQHCQDCAKACQQCAQACQSMA
ncbi:four-helix bundle copper-binding protein [Cupriavidus campinensis]|uniref:Four-helix bundle copper-binding protein n=1 Tax=Cupriavidus campinensis TaxID=151783 RepID=A0AAE9HYD2_9BURK|nr:four-helix bundle copper-binding protein [Cupriavidus campinensis]URF03979.1 four-helix bundle copper-binding protein [Cupriavidus campinensis]